MAYDKGIVRKACSLRRKGASVNVIAERFGVSKSTAYLWTKDLPVPKGLRENSRREHAFNIHAKRRQAREESYREGLIEAPQLLDNPLMRDFVVLYIAEGGKTVRGDINLANTDPEVISFVYSVFSRFSRNPVRLRIKCSQDEKKRLFNFWKKRLNMPKEYVRMLVSKEKKRKNRAPYGVAYLRCSDVLFFSRLCGWIDYVFSCWKNAPVA